MLDSRPNSSAGSQRPHTDGGGSTGRYGTVPVAVRGTPVQDGMKESVIPARGRSQNDLICLFMR